MDQFKLDGTPIPDDKIVNAPPPNIIALFGDWGYEEDLITEEEIYVTKIEDVRVSYCEFAEFEKGRNRCIGGCDSDSKGGIGYCIKLGTKMSILGKPNRVIFE